MKILAILSIFFSVGVATWVFSIRNWGAGIQTDAVLQTAYVVENTTGTYIQALHLLPALMSLLGFLGLIGFFISQSSKF